MNHTLEVILTVAVAVLGSNGLWALIQFLVGRKDAREDKDSKVLKAIRELSEKVTALEDKTDRNEAVQSRVRILRFADETQEGHKHSKDSFDQVMSDIDSYETYCEEHPGFKNNQTMATVAYIKRIYAERLEKHDFL